MATKLTEEKTILVKFIAKGGVQDIERGGGRVEKVDVDVEPAQAILALEPKCQGVSRVTFPVGAWENVAWEEGNAWGKQWFLPNGTILGYGEDGKPLDYSGYVTIQKGWVAFDEEGCPSLTTTETQKDFDRWHKSGNDWRSQLFPELVKA